MCLDSLFKCWVGGTHRVLELWQQEAGPSESLSLLVVLMALMALWGLVPEMWEQDGVQVYLEALEDQEDQ